ncbi:MAG: hypothetical protein OEY33_04690, partial [Bdellovibrionales bacterium]|nr:hypothetical protein [Bdellovibrionales bacterium]
MRLLFLLIFTSCAQLEDRPSSEKIIRKFYETSVWKEGAPKRAQWDKHVRHTFYNSFSYREKKALELVHEKAWSSLPKRDQLFDAIVKNKNQRQEFCKEIPKGGMLHVHPTGLVTREFLTKKIKSFKKKINPLDLLKSGTEGPRKELKKEEIRFLKQLKSKKFNSYTLVEQNKIIDLMFLKIEKAPFDFIRFQAVFSLLRYFIPKNKKIEFEILKDFLLNARNLGISYVELTNVFDFPINMKTLRNTTRRLYKETGVHVRWNVAFIRDNNKEKNRKLRDHLLSFKNRKDLYPIVGIDLVANEKTNDSLEHWEIYRP